MNLLTDSLVWCLVQVTLVSLLAWLMCAAIGRWTRPATALVPAVALAAVVVLTACAFVPWPNSWRYGPRWQSTAVEAGADSSSRLPGEISPGESMIDPPSVVPRPSPTAREYSAPVPEPSVDAVDIPSPVEHSPAAASGTSLAETFWSWLPVSVGLVLACGIVLGLAQLAGGLISVRAYRRASEPVPDQDLAELVDCLRAELCLTRPIDLRETSQLATAATVGWRRPVILLPRSWREWTADQRRAVLAHELAHVARGDYLACILAQLSLALHFYHPLVHWLAARLRLEQELAADAVAAELAGGRKCYLQSLAELALHTTERPLGWPAHTFLPTQGTFLRRIEMLRDSKHAPASSGASAAPRPRSALRFVAAGLLVLAAVAVAGLRGGPTTSPFDNPAAAGQAVQPPGAAAEPGGVDLTHVTNDAKMLLAIKPAQVLANEQIRKVVDDAMPAFAPLLKVLTMDGLAQVTFVGLPGVEVDDWADEPIVILQFSKDVTIDDFVKLNPDSRRPRRLAARAGELSEDGADGGTYGSPDDRTLIMGRDEDSLRKYLANRRKGQPAIAAGEAWQRVSMGAVVAAVDVEVFRDEFEKEGPPRGPAPELAALAPLWKDSEYLSVGIIIEGKTLHFRAVATASDKQLAENVADTARAAVTLARNAMRSIRERERDIPAFAQFMMQTGDGLLKTVKVEQAGTLVVAQTSTQVPEAISATAGSLAGAISEARSSAQKQVSQNNMRQIALALHNWADVHGGRFPPPVVMGKDGKGEEPHSWRIELLPYLEQNKLYEAYQFDEPWDSEANKLVLAQMPSQFRHPRDDAKSTKSAYFVLTPAKLLEARPVPGGAEAPAGGFPTAFSDKNGMSFSQIIDGTSNTIALVEAKRDIPWTKPEDILFDPAQDSPKLGGFFKDGFNVGLGDGSARFIDHKLDPKILKLLIMPQDGQPVPQF